MKRTNAARGEIRGPSPFPDPMPPLLERLQAMSDAATVSSALALGVLVVVADHLTGSDLSFSLFYVAPISMVAWRFGRRTALAAAALAAVAWYTVELIGDRVYTQPLIPLWNGIVRFGFFVIIAELLAVLRDSLRRQTREARIDPLTGLLNRRGFVERAQLELSRSERSRQHLTVAYFDVDRFKELNDTDGHAAGDELLRTVGATMRGVLRQVDVLGRMGGDEFALLLPETPSEEARRVIERLRTALKPIADQTGVSFSMGVVTFGRPPSDLGTALSRADGLMYAVKAEARGSARYESEPGST